MCNVNSILNLEQNPIFLNLFQKFYNVWEDVIKQDLDDCDATVDYEWENCWQEFLSENEQYNNLADEELQSELYHMPLSCIYNDSFMNRFLK